MDTGSLVAQIDALQAEYDALRERARYDDLSDLDEGGLIQQLGVRTAAAAERILPGGSHYAAEANGLVDTYSRNPGRLAARLLGVLQAFRTDLEAGYLRAYQEELRADLFADFLDMASYILGEIHRTPAAVVAGFTLEEHLRKLSLKNGLPVETGGASVKADAMNAELAKLPAYSKTEQKDVTAWLGRRNDAAHGHHDRYSDEQVALMIEGIRGFIGRHPA